MSLGLAESFLVECRDATLWWSPTCFLLNITKQEEAFAPDTEAQRPTIWIFYVIHTVRVRTSVWIFRAM